MKKKAEKAPGKRTGKQRLGEILIDSGLITENQLVQVLKRQTQAGGQLGSILIDLGFITIDDLLNFLSQKLGVPGVNLFNIKVDAKVLNLLPQEKIKNLKILPVAADETTVTLAMMNPQDFMTISEIEFMLGKKVKAAVVPSFMMEAALKSLPRPGLGLDGKVVAETSEIERAKMKELPELFSLLKDLVRSGVSDILLTAGVPPSIRRDNKLERLPMAPLMPVDCERFARELIPYNEWDDFIQTNEHDFAVSFPEIGRFRVNAYRQRHSIALAMRPLADDLTSLEELPHVQVLIL